MRGRGRRPRVVFPVHTANGLEVSAKVFVPAAGTAFVRHLWFYRNTATTPITIQGYRWNEIDYVTSDVLTTSSGDEAVTPADDWFTFDDSGDPTTPASAYVWQGTTGPRRTAVDSLFAPCCTTTPVPIADGSRRPSGATSAWSWRRGDRRAHAVPLRAPDRRRGARYRCRAGRGPRRGLRGPLRRRGPRAAQLRPADADRDGVANEADNCLNAVNADQANADGDAQGDACDEDDDNDGRSDALEAVFGTDPAKADSDGDGKPDPVDVCPRVAGVAANGCPALDAAQMVNVFAGRLDPAATSARLVARAGKKPPFRFTASGSIDRPPG